MNWQKVRVDLPMVIGYAIRDNVYLSTYMYLLSTSVNY